jgi:hypothetical protein
MKPRDLFQVLIATVGVIIFFVGAMYLADSLLFTLGLYELQHSNPKYYAFKGIFQMVLSVLVIKGFPPFLEMLYPRGEPAAPGKSEADKKHEA